MLGHEGQDEICDLICFLVECEVPGIKKVDLGIRQITLECLPAGGGEGWVIFPPNDERRRLVLTQPRLPRWIRVHIRFVVVEKFRLDLALTWLREMNVFVGPGVRIVAVRVRGSRSVSLSRRLER